MKICFFRHTLLNRGGDKMVVEYANHLVSLKHDVSILSNRVDSIFDVQARLEKIPGNGSKVSSIIQAVAGTINSDIIIADIIMMAFFLSFRNRKQLIYFAQDYDESYYKGFIMKLLIRLGYFICLRMLKIPVIAVSQELGQLLKDRFQADVTVVPNGVDTGTFYPDMDEEYLSLKKNSRVILLFARSDYRKGFDMAVKVLDTLQQEIESGRISVWAVGENLETPFRMRNFGFVHPEQLRKILSCSDVLLYPSRHEGFGLFVLEAMACGCPVVTTKAVQFAKDRENSMVAKDQKALTGKCAEILHDDILREHVRQNGLHTAQQYNFNNSKKCFGNLFHEDRSARIVNPLKNEESELCERPD